MTLNRWMDTQTIDYPYNGILFSDLKKRTIKPWKTRRNLKRTLLRKQHIAWKKPVWKGYILCNSHCMPFRKRPDYSDTKDQRRPAVGRGVRSEGWTGGAQGILGQWNYSVWYCNDPYMTFICQNPYTIQPMYTCVLVAQLCLALCDPTDCSLPGFSVHVILQARILQRTAFPFSRGSSQPRDHILVSCITGRFLTVWATGKSI